MTIEELLKEIELISKPGGKDGRGSNHVIRLDKINRLVREHIKTKQS